MITPEQEDRLVKLEDYVVEATGTPLREFWRGFAEIAQNLDSEAFAAEADGELLGRYTSLLANANEAGLAVPPEAMGASSPEQVSTFFDAATSQVAAVPNRARSVHVSYALFLFE